MTDDPFGTRSDERTSLVGFLDWYREVVVRKLTGLTEEQARWKPAPSANSLLGLVKHLAYVEHGWFAMCFVGREPDLPWDEDRGDDQDFEISEDETIDGVIALYRRECARSNEIVASAGSLDQVSATPAQVRGPVSLRWVLLHMIEETARHAGHADITRELIDGSVGD